MIFNNQTFFIINLLNLVASTNGITTATVSVIVSSLFSLSASAQDNENNEFSISNTEINIAIANIFAKDNLMYLIYSNDNYFPYSYSDYYRQPELVIGLKLHSKKGAFRVSTNIKYNNGTYESIDGQIEKYTFKTIGAMLNLGYEWHSSFSRVTIYYGFDFSTSYTGYYIEEKYELDFSNNVVTTEDTFSEKTYGANPLIGVNVYITPRLSIGTELKITGEYVSGESESKVSYSTNSDKSNSSGFRTRFGPIGFLSINLHL